MIFTHKIIIEDIDVVIIKITLAKNILEFLGQI